MILQVYTNHFFMTSITFSCMISGAKGEVVRVETELVRGLPYFIIVGLGDAAVTESRERVKVAMQSSGFDFPRFRKVVNLAPAGLKKKGTQFDLAIAVGLLKASKQIVAREILESSVFIGELALDGSIRGVRGTLAMTEAAKKAGYKCVFVGMERVREACLVPGIRVFAFNNLRDLVMHLKGEKLKREVKGVGFKSVPWKTACTIKGQDLIKRAINIAAAGRHHLVLTGPAGMGKSLLARSIQSLLPPLTENEIVEVIRLYSIFTDQDFSDGAISRPFREISHTTSLGSITGGGVKLQAGEMSFAHKGALFLDDIHNFSRPQIEALLKPMEERKAFVSSGKQKISLPSDFMLVATMNPCHCGKRTSLEQSECKCKEGDLRRFTGRFPQAFWDRVDMVVEVPSLNEEDFDGQDIGYRVEDFVFERQHQRLKSVRANYNGEMDAKTVEVFCPVEDSALELLNKALKMKILSGRGYFNTLKVAQSIADLNKHESIEATDVSEAMFYRKDPAR